MFGLRRIRIFSARGLVFVGSILIAPHFAEAGAAYVGVMPFSTQSARVPEAFSGLGFALSFYEYPGVGQVGYGLSFMDQGTAATVLLRFRYFISGSGPRPKDQQVAGISADRLRPVAVTTDPLQIYLDAAPAAYAASNTVYKLGTEVLYGFAGYVDGGINIRFLGIYFYGELGFYQSFSNSLSSTLTQIGVIIPVPF